MENLGFTDDHECNLQVVLKPWKIAVPDNSVSICRASTAKIYAPGLYPPCRRHCVLQVAPADEELVLSPRWASHLPMGLPLTDAFVQGRG